MAEPAGPVRVTDADARKLAFGAFVGTGLPLREGLCDR
jgi:hypothetical protein